MDDTAETREDQRARWRNRAWAGGAAAVTLLVYLQNLAPTVSVEDSGELAAAAYVLGIPHPTGYPLWCLLGKLFIVVLPFGDVAWRVNLMSAVFGAGTVCLVVQMVYALSGSRLGAVAAGLALAFSLEFWEQSVIAEVYALNAFLLAGCLLLLIEWRGSRRPGPLFGAWLLCGLGLANHSTMYLMVPIFAAYMVLADRPRRLPVRAYAGMALCLAAGFAVHLYLPLRSRTDPAMDWGNPETWQGFWEVFTRRQYQFLIARHPRSVGRFLEQAGVFLRTYAAQFTVWAAPAPAVGIVLLWRKHRAEAALLLAVAVVVGMASILIPNFEPDKKGIWINTTYWIPIYLVAAVFLGTAVAALMQSKRGPFRAAGWIVAGIAVVGPLVAHWRHNNMSEYYFTRDYAANILETLDPDALYFAHGDHSLFPVLYLQIVEGRRPDVVVANRYGFIEEDLYAGMPEEQRRGFNRYPSPEEQEEILAWIIEHTERPVYLKRQPSSKALAGRRLANAGLLLRVMQPGDPDPGDYWDRYQWHTVEVSAAHGDWTAELVLFDYWFARARDAFGRGEMEAGREHLGKALAATGETKASLNDAGTLCAQHGLDKEAEDYYRRALALFPRYETARRNLGILQRRRQKKGPKAQDAPQGPEDSDR